MVAWGIQLNERWVGGVHPTSNDGSSLWPGLGSCWGVNCSYFGATPLSGAVFSCSKGRTDPRIRQSEAKYIEKSDFDVKKSLVLPKSVENNEKPEKKNLIFFSKKHFRCQKIKNYKSSETRFAEVSTDSSHVRIENGRSKFASACFAKRKQSAVIRLRMYRRVESSKLKSIPDPG